MQLEQLLFVHRARRMGQQTLRALGFWEGHHVAKRLGAGHNGQDAVKNKRQNDLRRRAVMKGITEETELL